MITGTNPQLSFRGIKSIQHHARPRNKPTPLQTTRRGRCLANFKISHLNRNTLRKVLLKREGRVPPQTQIPMCFLSCPFLSFRDSIFLVSDRSAGLVRCRCCCCFVRFFLFWSDATMLLESRHRVSLTRTARASGYPRRSPGA
jgi:hypothetical protein